MPDLSTSVDAIAAKLRNLRPTTFHKLPSGTVESCAWGPCSERRRKKSKYCTDNHRHKNARHRYKMRKQGFHL